MVSERDVLELKDSQEKIEAGFTTIINSKKKNLAIKEKNDNITKLEIKNPIFNLEIDGD